VPFLKFSRDKRGYENLYLVEPINRRGRSRSQILYWFRTPPNVKVGREPFDMAVRQALEAQYPHLRFDWPRLLDIHIPPPEVEEWRERRRAARAAKQAADAEDVEEPAEPEGVPVQTVPLLSPPDAVVPAADLLPASDGRTGKEGQEGQGGQEGQAGQEGREGQDRGAVSDPNRRKRRRRRGRRGSSGVAGSSVSAPGLTPQGSAPESGLSQAPEPNPGSSNLEPANPELSNVEPERGTVEPEPGTVEPGTQEP
jgi:hypothetical protein